MPTTPPNFFNARRRSFGCAIGLFLSVASHSIVSAPLAFAIEQPPELSSQAAIPGAKPDFAKRANVVVLPVVVGGFGEPTAALVESLAKGLRDNLNWIVTVPSASTAVIEPVRDEKLLASALEAAQGIVIGGANAAPAILDLAAVFAQLVDVSTKVPLGASGAAAVLKIGGALISAQVAAGHDEAARATASEIKLLLPSRKFGEADGLTFVAAAVQSNSMELR
jgi:hypothetical protein